MYVWSCCLCQTHRRSQICKIFENVLYCHVNTILMPVALLGLAPINSVNRACSDERYAIWSEPKFGIKKSPQQISGQTKKKIDSLQAP